MPTYHSQTSQPALNLTLTGMGIIGTGSGMDGLTAQAPRPAASFYAATLGALASIGRLTAAKPMCKRSRQPDFDADRSRPPW